ncbi:PREDICTED: hydroxymethylglutaryl-CoA lyase, mitochondrial [Cyphomyrmex costatus]|uniref:hydroxymethylglutaryl-CoA lyase n=1 Tax=Cyphomyrmex costatus TaxID=456900 RepID=A0A151I7N9_9HYME|nr:PREDICTED: hydroxymethylglutaryl-CoA lyase, mitochondrial [Cyphomyrmex costatus]KYM94154.1 Hydroxymethylglutaryl-CoA lyase [Cyphomyrmex costatus]
MIELFSRQATYILPSSVRNCVWNYAIRQFSDFVKIVEVGPRDGLQNEKKILPTEVKVNFIDKLSATGLRSIEVTSFVSPKWVPQMADNHQVFQHIKKRNGVSYPVLVPNLKGLQSAIAAGVKEIAVFGAASETFCKMNINCSIEESVRNFRIVVEEAKKHDIRTRGYISCIVGCPYEGETKPATTAHLASIMLDLGCYEISLGDTIGVGSPRKIKRVLNELFHISSNDMSCYALHCHDTYGQALMNIHVGLENDIKVFDSSVAGLGGCPYAAGASGNVATEDLLYFLQGQGLETGIDLDEIVGIGDYISKELNRINQSKTGVAVLAKKNRQKC